MNQFSKTVVITEEHLKLIQASVWEMFDGDDGLILSQNGKRPYGNSDYIADIIEELGWLTKEEIDGYSDNDEDMPEELTERAHNIQEELAEVMQVCTQRMSFEIGTFKTEDKYASEIKWVKVV